MSSRAFSPDPAGIYLYLCTGGDSWGKSKTPPPAEETKFEPGF